MCVFPAVSVVTVSLFYLSYYRLECGHNAKSKNATSDIKVPNIYTLQQRHWSRPIDHYKQVPIDSFSHVWCCIFTTALLSSYFCRYVFLYICMYIKHRSKIFGCDMAHFISFPIPYVSTVFRSLPRIPQITFKSPTVVSWYIEAC